MSRLVPAYDVATGKKLPYLVPEHTFDNPVHRGKIRPTPKSVAATQTRRPTPAPAVKKNTNPTQTPAAGDKKEK